MQELICIYVCTVLIVQGTNQVGRIQGPFFFFFFFFSKKKKSNRECPRIRRRYGVYQLPGTLVEAKKKKKNNHTNPGLRWPGTVFFTHSGINLVGYDYAGVCKYGELIYTLCRPWMAFPCKYYNPMFLLIHFEIYLWSVLLGV